jgi:hypothetical protein
MKHLKLFEGFLKESELSGPEYKKPEYEFKEFYRIFKKYPELRETLPPDIDREIFSIKGGGGFDGEPLWIGSHLDPPSKDDEIGTAELIEIAEKNDPRFIPFIEYCQRLFEEGKMKRFTLNFIRNNLDTKIKGHDWGILKTNPNYINDCEAEYNKALAAGIKSDEGLNKTGLVQKYPGVKINLAQFWALYTRDSFKYFNLSLSKGDKIPCTQFILHNGVYYTVGGRRRMFWHFYKKFDPTVWVIPAQGQSN